MRDNSIMKIRFLLMALLVLSCFTLFASDQPKTVIKIMVTNQFDKPVENAEVILDFLGSRQITKVGLGRRFIGKCIPTNRASPISRPFRKARCSFR